MDTLGAITWFALGAWLLLSGYWWLGIRRMPQLRARPGPAPAEGWPRLSLIVAARDEAATIGPALRTWLRQDYPGLEIVVVDDRSVDGTAAAVQAVLDGYGVSMGEGAYEAPSTAAESRPGAAESRPGADEARPGADEARLGADEARLGADEAPSVWTVRLEALPDGWLGKTHAQAHGARLATGAWLLFLDADVRLAPNALRAAITAALRERVDHLALLPRFDAPGPAWRAHPVLAFETAFTLLLTLLLRPWLAPDPGASTTLGIGAFGLYRRDAYERAGGHDSVRLRPDDDLALAHSVKAAGGRSLVVFAPGLAVVTWYETLGQAVQGLEKNAFAGLGFSLVRVTLVSAGLLATHVLPFAMVVLAGGADRAAAVGVVLVVTAVYAWYGRRVGQPAWYALLHGVSVLALVFALWRSTAAALVTGRIDWRGTSYAVPELQAAQRARPRARSRAQRGQRGQRNVGQSRNSPRT